MWVKVLSTFKHNTSYTKSHLVVENYMGDAKPTPFGKLTYTLYYKESKGFVVKKTVYFYNTGNNTQFIVCTRTEQKYRTNVIFMT